MPALQPPRTPPPHHTPVSLHPAPTQFENLPYSRGVRQKLARQAWEEDWAGAHNILVLDNTNVTQKTYSEFLVESTFCLAIIGKSRGKGGERRGPSQARHGGS